MKKRTNRNLTYAMVAILLLLAILLIIRASHAESAPVKGGVVETFQLQHRHNVNPQKTVDTKDIN